jgi:cyclopropane-fatty-acyl-phospholipid synthase
MSSLKNTPGPAAPAAPGQVEPAEGIQAAWQVFNLLFEADDSASGSRSTLPPGLGVRLWDGSYWPRKANYKTTLVINNPFILRKILLAGTELIMADAYIYHELDIEGDLTGIFPLALIFRNLTQGPLGGLFKKARLLRAILRLPAEKPLLPELVHLRPKKPDWNGAADSGNEGSAGALKVVKQTASETGSDLNHGSTLPKPSGLSRYLPPALKGRQHTPARDRQAIAYHYNLSNDFYSLWLDPTMTYSCAYFQSEEASLAQAQQSKLEYICRKLRLKPGQRLLDIGCGWGGLAIYAATHYGVEVLGITLSHLQAELANQRIAEAGLVGRVQVVELDYRELKEQGAFDALVSVGMFEHVGRAMLPTYFKKAYELLKPGGVFLNHGIAFGNAQEEARGPSFTDTYVFPDGELVPINVSLKCCEEAGLEVRDVESLREHYRLTLQHWSANLAAHLDQARADVGDPTLRVWRLYLAASAFGFSANWLNLYQTLLVKPDQNGAAHLPLTRSDWYATQA